MRRRHVRLCVLGLVSVIAWAGALAAQKKVDYGRPRYPHLAQAPKSAAEALPIVRGLVRTTGGRTPLGLVQPGQRVIIFAGPTLWLERNYVIMDAMIQAFRERQVDAVFVLRALKGDWVSTGPGFDTQKYGWAEGIRWIEGFSRPDEVKAWLRSENPKLYTALFGTGPEAIGRPPSEFEDVVEDPSRGAEPTKRPEGAVSVLPETRKKIAANPNIVVWIRIRNSWTSTRNRSTPCSPGRAVGQVC
jgi:hypothetical protein